MMMLAKLVILGLLKIKLFKNKDYDVITTVHDVTSKFLTYHSIYIVEMVI